ncbi:MAG: hypothetical protein M1830_002654 [Pleopsidium flavum]|nr:MAG: hypothetical protein M1830_002654 [Pleopsidium flavum]
MNIKSTADFTAQQSTQKCQMSIRLAAEVLQNSVYSFYGRDSSEDLEDDEYKKSGSDDQDSDELFSENSDEVSDTQKDIILEFNIIKKLCKKFTQLTIREQKVYSQDKMNLRQLLCLSSTHRYTMNDLKNSDTLN